MDGSVARVTFEHDSAMEFDVQAVVDLGDPTAKWIVDTDSRWETLQTSEEACRMRFMRGLQQLRREFEKEGLTP